MLTELRGKGGCLCQPARQGELRCPLIVRPTSEDVITGHVFQTLKNINPRHWLPQLLNQALGTNRFRQQCYRKLRIELWANQASYPPELLPWKEGSTQVDVMIKWENPPTTVFIEAKYKASLTPRSQHDDGRSGYPSDQFTRNLRVGLYRAGYFEGPILFQRNPRDFVLLLFSPDGQHELVRRYQHPQAVLSAIPHSDRIMALPRTPFVGHLSYRRLCQVLRHQGPRMTRPERMLAFDLIEYLNFKLSDLTSLSPLDKQLELTSLGEIAPRKQYPRLPPNADRSAGAQLDEIG